MSIRVWSKIARNRHYFGIFLHYFGMFLELIHPLAQASDSEVVITAEDVLINPKVQSRRHRDGLRLSSHAHRSARHAHRSAYFGTNISIICHTQGLFWDKHLNHLPHSRLILGQTSHSFAVLKAYFGTNISLICHTQGLFWDKHLTRQHHDTLQRYGHGDSRRG